MTRRPALRAMLAAIATVLSLTLAGCSNNAPGDISPAAKRLLRPAVEHLRVGAASNSFGALRIAVNDFKDLVNQEERAGEVSASRALALRDAADALLLDAKPSPSPTPSPTTTSPTPSPTPTTESPTQPHTTPPPSPTPTVSVTVSTSTQAESASPPPSQSAHPIISPAG